MKQLGSLIKEYSARTDSNVLGNELAIKAKEPIRIPILVSNKWENVNNKVLTKTFMFQKMDSRNRFVESVLDYEMSVGHYGCLTISDKNVNILIQTHKIDVVTELDHEYTKFVDLIFKDIAYTPVHEPEE